MNEKFSVSANELLPPEILKKEEVERRFKMLKKSCSDFSEENSFLISTYQQFLHLAGFGGVSGDVDGIYGPKTKNAMNEWLDSEYLPQDESLREIFHFMNRRLKKLESEKVVGIELKQKEVLKGSKDELNLLNNELLELQVENAEKQLKEIVRITDKLSNSGMKVYKHIFTWPKAVSMARDLKKGWDQGAYSGQKEFDKALEALTNINPNPDQFILQIAVEQVTGLRKEGAVNYFKKYADLKHKLKRSD